MLRYYDLLPINRVNYYDLLLIRPLKLCKSVGTLISTGKICVTIGLWRSLESIACVFLAMYVILTLILKTCKSMGPKFL